MRSSAPLSFRRLAQQCWVPNAHQSAGHANGGLGSVGTFLGMPTTFQGQSQSRDLSSGSKLSPTLQSVEVWHHCWFSSSANGVKCFWMAIISLVVQPSKPAEPEACKAAFQKSARVGSSNSEPMSCLWYAAFSAKSSHLPAAAFDESSWEHQCCDQLARVSSAEKAAVSCGSLSTLLAGFQMSWETTRNLWRQAWESRLEVVFSCFWVKVSTMARAACSVQDASHVPWSAERRTLFSLTKVVSGILWLTSPFWRKTSVNARCILSKWRCKTVCGGLWPGPGSHGLVVGKTFAPFSFRNSINPTEFRNNFKGTFGSLVPSPPLLD